jgi:uncharacterized repeat protein (TIGR01451 family)
LLGKQQLVVQADLGLTTKVRWTSGRAAVEDEFTCWNLRRAHMPLALRSGATRRRNLIAVRAVVGAAVLSAALVAAPSAFSLSASSPGDLGVSISTPGPVVAGVSTPYTVAVTNNTPYLIDNHGNGSGTNAQGQTSSGYKLDGFSGSGFCERVNSNSKGTLRGPLFSCSWTTPVAGIANGTPAPLAAGETASWIINMTAAKAGVTESVHVDALGIFSQQGTSLGIGVSNSVDLSVPVQAPVAAGGGVTAPAAADLALTGSASNGSPALGAPFSYKFQVKNNGKGDASAATFDDPLPASVTATSATTDTGTCSLDTAANSVHCDLGTMAAGKQATITVNATAPSVTGAVTNSASTATTSTDINLANNGASVTVQPK